MFFLLRISAFRASVRATLGGHRPQLLVLAELVEQVQRLRLGVVQHEQLEEHHDDDRNLDDAPDAQDEAQEAAGHGFGEVVSVADGGQRHDHHPNGHHEGLKPQVVFFDGQRQLAEADHEREDADGDEKHEDEEPNGPFLDENFDDEDVAVLHPVDAHDLQHFDRVVVRVLEDHPEDVEPAQIHDDRQHQVDRVFGLDLLQVVDDLVRVLLQLDVRSHKDHQDLDHQLRYFHFLGLDGLSRTL